MEGVIGCRILVMHLRVVVSAVWNIFLTLFLIFVKIGCPYSSSGLQMDLYIFVDVLKLVSSVLYVKLLKYLDLVMIFLLVTDV